MYWNYFNNTSSLLFVQQFGAIFDIILQNPDIMILEYQKQNKQVTLKKKKSFGTNLSRGLYDSQGNIRVIWTCNNT